MSHTAADDIEMVFSGADVVDFRTNIGFLPTYLRHHQLRPTLTRYVADGVAKGLARTAAEVDGRVARKV